MDCIICLENLKTYKDLVCFPCGTQTTPHTMCFNCFIEYIKLHGCKAKCPLCSELLKFGFNKPVVTLPERYHIYEDIIIKLKNSYNEINTKEIMNPFLKENTLVQQLSAEGYYPAEIEYYKLRIFLQGIFGKQKINFKKIISQIHSFFYSICDLTIENYIYPSIMKEEIDIIE